MEDGVGEGRGYIDDSRSGSFRRIGKIDGDRPAENVRALSGTTAVESVIDTPTDMAMDGKDSIHSVIVCLGSNERGMATCSTVILCSRSSRSAITPTPTRLASKYSSLSLFSVNIHTRFPSTTLLGSRLACRTPRTTRVPTP